MCSLASCKRIVEVIDEKPALDDSRATDARVCRGSVSFQNVFFKYSDAAEEYVLSDINLEIAAGETVGIIGQTGSAKTTLVQLIPRLYEGRFGNIPCVIFGTPLRWCFRTIPYLPEQSEKT